MSEAETKTETTAKSRAARTSAAGDGGFQFPQFEMPKFELPDSFRAMAAQWVDQGKANFEKALTTAEEMTGVCSRTCSNAAKGTADYTAKASEVVHNNAIATFDLVHHMMAAKSLPEMIEISMADGRKQFETLAAQTQELWSLAQKAAVETLKPVTADLPKVFQPSAST
ncbi:MAG: phasin family protein [Pseudorhodoplanes sp.]|nr:phasin family protein [Pseudorhodoplanes sp.]